MLTRNAGYRRIGQKRRLDEQIATHLARLALIGCIGLLLGGCGKPPEKQAVAPEVVVAAAQQRDVPVYLDLVGEAQGSQDVEIRARVEGYLQSVNFAEGSFVEKGTLLYQIDPKPLQADLATVQARLTKASGDVERFTPLFEKQAVSRQELDNAIAARDAARAQVDLARLNLGYATIRSPIDGVVGITNVKSGNLVGRGESTLLTTVSQINPIVFRVGISEAEYFKIAKRGNRGDGKNVDVQLELANGEIFPHKGHVEAVDRGIDAQTGTLEIKFAFDNPNRLIRPGQYGRLRVSAEVLPGALLVPQRAVRELQGMYQLAVVGADNKVELRSVTVGPRFGDLWVISAGLKPGERFVVEGLQRVRNGVMVSPKSAEAAPVIAKPDPVKS